MSTLPPPRALVLLAHPDEDFAARARAALEEAAFDVVIASDGVDAVTELHGAEFDVAIVHLELPRRPGLDVLRAARILAPETELIMTTARAELAATLECLRGGAFDLFEAPFNVAELVASVARVAERRRSRTTAMLYAACSGAGRRSTTAGLPAELVAIGTRALDADVAVLAELGRATPVVRASPDGAIPDPHRLAALLASAAPRQALLFPGEASEIAGFEEAAADAGLRSAIVHPLVSEGFLIGLLVIGRTSDPRRFSRADLDRAGVVAAPLVLALENARLLARMLTSERLAAVGELSAGVAHEINNPLMYLLASQTSAEEVVEALALRLRTLPIADHEEVAATLAGLREMLHDVAEGASRIAEISADLRSLSRGADTPEHVVDVSESVRSALRICAAKLRGSANVRLDLQEGVRVVGRAGRLCQVFVNLLVNAAEAAVDVVGRVDVRVSTRSEGETVTAVIRDNGPGIAPEHMNRLFDAFFSTKAAGSGTGLGLPLSRRIVEEMGGSLYVASEVGKGAVFSITLPAARAAAPATRRDDPGAVPRLRLLFVDDEPGVLRAYERWFGRDHDVVTAESGEQALRVIDAGPPFDAIVTDVVMGATSGLDLHAELGRQRPELADRVVFVTGNGRDPAYARRLAATGRPVLDKPLDMRRARSVIEETAATTH